ncbi:LacI family DNA-binding transcriptional regulator [Prauserella halophila]|uniref:LacI family DNA-binding transcriptional regulator n=1 Tax=Prauserella halophila TaxID=185641 RepID=A0ABN1WBJ0_9PSEU|nr:LacI family DNA-binding transcriptional regulator [Prauserella halophila]MCP2236864.1 transcriptional regulator, LacI family [Prauserella halophila]
MPKRPSRPTQRDIADLAGVSITTVSHVVNDTRTVAPATREAVLAAVEQTGYTGDVIARSLVTGGTQTIGLAVPLSGSPHIGTLVQAVEREAAAAGYTVLLSDTHDCADTERAVVRALRAHRIEGVVLVSAPDDRDVVDELLTAGVPTVLLDRLTTRSDIDQVGPENIQTMSALTEHVAARAHRRIGLVSGPEGQVTSDERVLGYRLGLGRARVPWSPELVVTGEPSRDGGAAALATLLELPEPPTAVLAADDAMAAGVVVEARRRGLRIGTDLALACFDEPEWSDLVDPPLTTVAQAVADMGGEAMRLLLARLKDPEREPETVRLPPAWRHRTSCGCPPENPTP